MARVRPCTTRLASARPTSHVLERRRTPLPPISRRPQSNHTPRIPLQARQDQPAVRREDAAAEYEHPQRQWLESVFTSSGRTERRLESGTGHVVRGRRRSRGRRGLFRPTRRRPSIRSMPSLRAEPAPRDTLRLPLAAADSRSGPVALIRDHQLKPTAASSPNPVFEIDADWLQSSPRGTDGWAGYRKCRRYRGCGGSRRCRGCRRLPKVPKVP